MYILNNSMQILAIYVLYSDLFINNIQLFIRNTKENFDKSCIIFAVSLSVDALSMWQNEWSFAINFDHDTFTFLLSYTIKIFVSCHTTNGHLWFMMRIIVFIFIFAWSYLHVWLWLCYCISLLKFFLIRCYFDSSLPTISN